MRPLFRSTVVGAALVLVSTGCGHTDTAADHGADPQRSTAVRVEAVRGVGRVLVTHAGRTLYMFPPDRGGRVTCTGACAGTWPPLRLGDQDDALEKPEAGPGVRPGLLGSVPNPTGGRVVTYHGWPLYTYVGDIDPGQATGQALDLNGAPWYVLRPSGKPVIPSRGPS